MEVMEVGNSQVQIREYKNQRVITFKDIDIVHNRPDGTARKRFSSNRKRFIEGVDYFKITPATIKNEMSVLRTLEIANVPNRGLTLITESGYLMLVKTFEDDLAWEVQRTLVNCYFKVKSLKQEEVSQSPQVQKNYNVSLTILPKNQNWFSRNSVKISYICDKIGCSRSKLYHRILLWLGTEYDLDYANKVYEQELGYKPHYAMDIVSYFPQLSQMADDYLNATMSVIRNNEE